MKHMQNLETSMKTRKRNAPAPVISQDKPTRPKTMVAEITGCAIRLTSDRAQAHKRCERRDCRTERSCMSEGWTGDDISPCARHWTDHDHGYFQGAFMFGALHLCPRIPKGVDPKEYRWQEGVEDNPYDLVPKILFVHRKASIKIEKTPYGYTHIQVRDPL
jgi:hypothetical protein